jgi:hypothetical protein
MRPRRLALLEEAFGEWWPAAARRYGVTHVVVDEPFTEGQRARYALATGGGVRLGSAGSSGEVWSVPHREWAYFAPEVRVVEDTDAALLETGRAIAGRSPATVVEGPGPLPAAPGRVLAVARGLESLRVEAEAGADGALVVADAFWPGWEATVDGVAVPILPADVLVRAVPWPAGRHVLEMRYRPPEVRAGLLASALGLAALAGWAALLGRGRRASPSPRSG